MRHLIRHHDACWDQVQHSLGQHRFDTEFRTGLDMSVDDAVCYALEEQEGTAEPTASTRMHESLTSRESQVAQLIAQGMSNKAIASKLVIAQRTAEAHVEHILGKLGFSSRSQVAAWITEHRPAATETNEHA
jgi:DNA-binding NarL/FixJ family response regulator